MIVGDFFGYFLHLLNNWLVKSWVFLSSRNSWGLRNMYINDCIYQLDAGYFF